MLELKSRKLDLKFNDKVYSLKYPTVMELKGFSSAKKEDELDSVVDLLVKSGLPENICNQLEVQHMKAILTELTTEKK